LTGPALEFGGPCNAHDLTPAAIRHILTGRNAHDLTPTRHNDWMPQSSFCTRLAAVSAALALFPALAHAQSTPQVTLPTVTVTAQKEPADQQTIPVSVSAIPSEWLRLGRITWITDAVVFAPNSVVTEFTARKLSNPRVRGIGSSPANPAITTYLDGVPVLNANASSVEFTAVEQIEFVRGPQSALFGRNTIGGVINIASQRPSLSGVHGDVVVPVGNFGAREVRGSVSAPINDRLSFGASAGHAQRDGFTVNRVTGNDIDSRSADFGKAQLSITPSSRWETRVIVSGERAEDGDYALNDLAAVRANPYVIERDFEGFTHRNIFNTTVNNRYEGAGLSVTATTGIIRWDTEDQTDLDYSPYPLGTRRNVEDATQFTQEVRVASAPGKQIAVSDAASLKWQAGVLFFTQDYDQEAVNSLAPFVLSPMLGLAVQQTSPRAALSDSGIGVYGQGTFTIRESLDVTLGARLDHESKDARLETFLTPAIAPPTLLDTDASFSNVSPQLAVAYRLNDRRMLYVSAARGFKAGGFNPASPAGAEAFGEESSWNVEGGVKATWADGRVLTNAAVFFTDWTDLQLNLPNPQVPAQFYIANVGGAQSRGVELELTARPARGIDLFSAFGYTHARFGEDTFSSGVNVSDNAVPFTPDYTVAIGAQITRDLTSRVALYGRGELTASGAFHYDDTNLASQDAYSLVHLRGGVRSGRVFAEAWVRNAFDTRYVPVAFAYPGLAPSGFVGEPGRPRTFGLSAGISF
jgi:iron complex outermembrane receptor protein